MTYCLDSWAVLAWMEGRQPAATRVEEVLPDRPVMNWINLGEVFYVVGRQAGLVAASSIIKDLERRLVTDEATRERVLEAATIKAQYPMALGDAFALATAGSYGSVLLTGDSEILEADGHWATEDLR